MRTPSPIAAAFALSVVLCVGFCSMRLTAAENAVSAIMDLVVVEIRERHPPYERFCTDYNNECELTPPYRLEMTAQLLDLASRVNRTVNHDVIFSLDMTQYGEEEYWNYPDSGFGDCEDKSLEKRRRLVMKGISRGALRMAIAHHRTHHTPHSVLLLETSQGTYVLDTYTSRIKLWHETPYNFEARERTNGTWERFDQQAWKFADVF